MKKKIRDCTIEEIIGSDWNYCKDGNYGWKCKKGCPFSIHGNGVSYCSRYAFENAVQNVLDLEVDAKISTDEVFEDFDNAFEEHGFTLLKVEKDGQKVIELCVQYDLISIGYIHKDCLVNFEFGKLDNEILLLIQKLQKWYWSDC